MNLLDYCVIAVLLVYILRGLYKGFIGMALGIGAFILTWLLALLFMGVGAKAIKNSAHLYDMMLYYTEGSEYIVNNVGVESAHMNIDQLSGEELDERVSNANVPYPMDKEIRANIAKEAFAKQNITTLGDYFNQTIVSVFINILSFFLFFFLFRLILIFLIEGVDYAWQLPMLRRGDILLGGALGIIRGMLTLFLLFMLMPVLLSVVGQFDLIVDMVENSFFAPFFYYSNFLLSMIPGV